MILHAALARRLSISRIIDTSVSTSLVCTLELKGHRDLGGRGSGLGGRLVYGRYREWLKESRWQRVLEALRTDGASTVEEEVAP